MTSGPSSSSPLFESSSSSSSSSSSMWLFLLPSLFWVRLLFAVVLSLYLLQLAWPDTLVSALALTPGYFWPPHFHLWTALTHCLVEEHLPLMLAHGLIILLATKLLEPLWGPIEMMAFFVMTNVGVALLSAFAYYLLYMLTFRTDLLFEIHVCGLSGFIAGLMVAVKQAMPDHVIVRSPIGKITNRNVPLSFFLIICILVPLNLIEGSYLSMYGFGILLSWTYLRFFQNHANGSKGDMAESFAFHTFFPNVLQPPISILAGVIYTAMVTLKICQKDAGKYYFSTNNSQGSSSSTSISISLPGMDQHDSERRRQIALKALSERLTKIEASSTSGADQLWPNIEGSNDIPAVPQPLSVHGKSKETVRETEEKKTEQSVN